MKNFNSFPISTQNCFTFSKDTFDLSKLYEELDLFYTNVGFNNDIYYAHAFNKDGLFHSPYPVKGFQVKKMDLNSSFFNFFSDKDITFSTDIENDKFNNYYNTMYKYNILSLYNSLLKSFEGQNVEYNPLFKDYKIEKLEFFLFISKTCINFPEFYSFKYEFLNEYNN